MKLSYIAEYIGLQYSGDDIEISSLNTLKDASENELTFFHSDKYQNDIPDTKAAAIIIDAKFSHLVPSTCKELTTDEPYLKMAVASKLFAPKLIDNELGEADIAESSYISEKAEVLYGSSIGDNSTIMANVSIGCNVKIGKNVTIHPNVSIYRDSVIGDNVIIHSGTIIGSDGFGFAHTKLGEHVKIYQNGNVIIEDSVEIGSNCTVDCAVFGSTLIRKGTKIDNLVQIGHNCDIGEHSIIVSQVGISGSSKLGRNVVMGGQSATSGHLEIAPFTTIAARGGVTKDIKEPHKTFSGFPLMEHKTWLRLQGKIAKLLK
jgi:UDP-3-O-[3-hydroxymyristoyl] glucosamine N-acyltransferase